MTGLELSRRYCDEVAYPAFAAGAPEDIEFMAFGLVGPGSECLGFDDRFSRDHDWGARVCIWIPEGLYLKREFTLQGIYESLPGTFLGYPAPQRLEDPGAPVRRDGIISIERFYAAYLGTDRPPGSDADWLRIPEEALSLCTSGEVFRDGPGTFSTLRDSLAGYYPETLRLRKASAACRAAGRNGQYDLGRALMRGDTAAAECARAAFAREIAVLGHLARRKFRPWDKWLFRSLAESDAPGKRLADAIGRLWDSDEPPQLKDAVDSCVSEVIRDMKNHGLPVGEGEYLYDIGLGMEKE